MTPIAATSCGTSCITESGIRPPFGELPRGKQWNTPAMCAEKTEVNP